MTVKEYILGKPNEYKFEIVYQFQNFCPNCKKGFLKYSEEESGFYTAAELRDDVSKQTGYYGGYPWVFDDFETDSSSVNITTGEDGCEVITICANGDDMTLCPDCETDEE